jgi:H+/gluconate symporter-like permease
MKIVKEFFEAVFSFAGFMTVACVLLVLILTAAMKNDNDKKALAEAITKACYDTGMIKVDTDAGAYCVVPANLVKVKS